MFEFYTLGDKLKIFIEIFMLWCIFYYLLIFIKGSRVEQLIKGILIIILIVLLTKVGKLYTINWILTKVFAISIIGFVIIFQPELRRALTQIGRFGATSKKSHIIDDISRALIYLSNRKIGALIVLERDVGLRHYEESGVFLNAKISSELLCTIFTPLTPLHDGGVIIKDDRVTSAGCLLPLTQQEDIPTYLGTRHRAAIGLTEETDAICIIVSEETGSISLAAGGKLTRDILRDDLSGILTALMHNPSKLKNKKNDR